MIKKHKKYKCDKDGVILMRKAFPTKKDPTALEKALENKKIINAMAFSVFNRNYIMFSQVGIDRDDIESIFNCHAYVFFHKRPDATPGILNNFLKQRGLKLIKTYTKIANTMIESANDISGVMAEDMGIDFSNPEDIFLAKEKLAAILKEVNVNLIQKNKRLIDTLYMKVKNMGISYNDAHDTAHRVAMAYVSKKYRENDETIRSEEFRKFLKNQFEKILHPTRVRAVNE